MQKGNLSALVKYSSVQEVMVTHLFLLEETLRRSQGWPASFLTTNKDTVFHINGGKQQQRTEFSQLSIVSKG